MFGFFKKKEKKQREEVINELMSLVGPLKDKNKEIQFAVGYGVNMASSIFYKSFSSVDHFEKESDKVKLKFFDKFLKFEKLMRDEDPFMSMGVRLYSIWVLAIINKDCELFNLVNDELKWISKKADIEV
jgi:hypothetical protein